MEADSCRICLGDVTEGRFISPCKCKGTIRLVHAHCLEKWRTSSTNPTSYWKCDQCKYKYSFRRTFMARMLRNVIVVHFATIACFFICSLFLGMVAGYVTRVNHTFPTYSSYMMFHTVYGAMLSSIVGFCSLLCSILFSVGFITGPTFPFSCSGINSNNSDRANTIIVIMCMIIGLCYVFYHVYLLVSYLT